MNNRKYQLYSYRWVVLAVFMFVNMMMQLLWISYAPITGDAARYYQVDDLKIGFLAMSFMIIFIPLSIPESWAIDRWGYRKAVGLGAILMGIFSIVRGLTGANYPLVLFSTLMIAVGQPFMMNSWTTVPAKWFQQEFRATAVGLVTLAGLIGVALGMVATPLLAKVMSISNLQLIYGIISAFSAMLFLILAREKPPTPPNAEEEKTRALMLEGLKNALSSQMFWKILIIAFIGMAIFNGVTTWVENIIRPRGFTPSDAGTLGALLLVGGICGAILLPALSDKEHKRKKYLFIGLGMAIPGLMGITFSHTYWVLLCSAFALGFFLTSASPISMQFGAEITQPTPEGTSNGLFQLSGQISVVFVYIMEVLKTRSGAFTPGLLFAALLLILCLFVISQIKEPSAEIEVKM